MLSTTEYLSRFSLFSSQSCFLHNLRSAFDFSNMLISERPTFSSFPVSSLYPWHLAHCLVHWAVSPVGGVVKTWAGERLREAVRVKSWMLYQLPLWVRLQLLNKLLPFMFSPISSQPCVSKGHFGWRAVGHRASRMRSSNVWETQLNSRKKHPAGSAGSKPRQGCPLLGVKAKAGAGTVWERSNLGRHFCNGRCSS